MSLISLSSLSAVMAFTTQRFFLRFELCDLDDPNIPYPDNHFDLVHARSIHIGVRMHPSLVYSFCSLLLSIYRYFLSFLFLLSHHTCTLPLLFPFSDDTDTRLPAFSRGNCADSSPWWSRSPHRAESAPFCTPAPIICSTSCLRAAPTPR